MEAVYSAIQAAIAFSKFWFVIGGLIAFLFALFPAIDQDDEERVGAREGPGLDGA